MKVDGKLSRKARKFLDKTSGISNLEEIKTQFKLQHADFSDFYRMLYQVLKFIKEHEKDIDDQIFDRKNVSPKVKNYTNILRSYLDTNLLYCLAINCYCLENEKGEYRNYKILIERYEILEPLPTYNSKTKFINLSFPIWLYYEEKAFGKSSWFNSFSILRDEFLELYEKENIYDLDLAFLKILYKNGGIWKSFNQVKMTVSFLKDEEQFYLDIYGLIESYLNNETESFILKIGENGVDLTGDNYNFSFSKTYIEKDGLVLYFLNQEIEGRPPTLYNEIKIRINILDFDNIEMNVDGHRVKVEDGKVTRIDFPIN